MVMSAPRHHRRIVQPWRWQRSTCAQPISEAQRNLPSKAGASSEALSVPPHHKYRPVCWPLVTSPPHDDAKHVCIAPARPGRLDTPHLPAFSARYSRLLRTPDPGVSRFTLHRDLTSGLTSCSAEPPLDQTPLQSQHSSPPRPRFSSSSTSFRRVESSKSHSR